MEGFLSCDDGSGHPSCYSSLDPERTGRVGEEAPEEIKPGVSP